MKPMAKSLLTSARRSRRRVGLALLAITAAAVAIGLILGANETGSSRGADPVATSSGATTVQRRDLIATDTESGTLSYADPQTVFNRLDGTVTWLPQVGDVIKPGQALYRVDGTPIILLDGTVPAYRTLTDGISDGADVKELKRNLKALGFDPNNQITINDTFDSATTDAIDRWQSSRGETQTGAVTLGQVVFLPGAQRITAVDAALGATGSSGMGSGSGSGAGGGGVESSGASNAGAAGTAASGAGSGGAQPILSTTSTKLIVSVDLDATKQTEATVREPVTVELPSGRTVGGKITKVSRVAQRSSTGSGSDSGSGSASSSPSATIPVTITLRKGQHVTGLDQAAVSVDFEKQVKRNVLSVPVTALLATAGGGYAVQESAPGHRLIPTTVGLFAAGYVQISGPGVYSGLRVTDSQG